MPDVVLFKFAIAFGENESPTVKPDAEGRRRYYAGRSHMSELERLAQEYGGDGALDERKPQHSKPGRMMRGGPILQHLATLDLSVGTPEALPFLRAARPIIIEYLETRGGRFVFKHGDLSIECEGAECVEQIENHLEKMDKGSNLTGVSISTLGGNVSVGNAEGGDAVGGDAAGGDKKSQEPAATHRYEVWYATNRQATGSISGAKGFASTAEEDGIIYYGKCFVDVPKTHQFGSLGTRWWKRWSKLRFEDDHLRLERIERFTDGAQFASALRKELGTLDEAERQILVYLHGYNVTFEDAALRAAQMGFDLKIEGATAFFSWPSCGTLAGYFADADRIAASERAIAAFLIDMAKGAGASKIHIIAHSMGNRGLARAMQRIFAEASMHSGLRFGHIILAAPDIEVSLFRELAAIYPLYCEHATMYVSARDKALGMSKWLQASERAGFTPPVTVVPGIDTIEVTDIDLTLLGHGYYAEADGVIRDMFDLVHFNALPDKRPRTRSAPTGDPYWVITR